MTSDDLNPPSPPAGTGAVCLFKPFHQLSKLTRIPQLFGHLAAPPGTPLARGPKGPMHGPRGEAGTPRVGCGGGRRPGGAVVAGPMREVTS